MIARRKLEALVWKHKHRDYRGRLESGERAVLQLERSTGATLLSPLARLTEAELLDMLPRPVRASLGRGPGHA